MKIEEGKMYMTRRGDLVDQIAHYKYGEADTIYFTGRMTTGDGSDNFATWNDDGIYLGNCSTPLEVGNHEPADIVAEFIVEIIPPRTENDENQANRLLLDHTLSDVEKMVKVLESYLLYH